MTACLTAKYERRLGNDLFCEIWVYQKRTCGIIFFKLIFNLVLNKFLWCELPPSVNENMLHTKYSTQRECFNFFCKCLIFLMHFCILSPS